DRGEAQRKSNELYAFTDHGVAPGDSVGYRLMAAAGGALAGSEVWAKVPGWGPLALASRYGNPSRGGLVFRAIFPGPGSADLAVFDVSGRRVRRIRLEGVRP